jgi:tetratricopeptide (TPR) repeat protein
MNSPDNSEPLTPDNLADFLLNSLSNLSEDPEEALQQMASISEEMGRFADDEEYEDACKLLEAETYSRQGQLCIGRGEFSQGAEVMQKASEIFTELDIGDRAKMCRGMNMYLSGVAELQRLNLADGQELLRQAETHLSGTVNPQLRRMLDHLAPDQLFIAGGVALVRGDLQKAQVLMTDAARRMENLGKVYYQDEPSNQTWFFGVADLYRAYFEMSRLAQSFRTFNLEGIDQANEFSRTAQRARERLELGEAPAQVKQSLSRLAMVSSAAIDAVLGAAPVVDAMLKRKLPPPIDLVAIENRLKEAELEAAAGGEAGISLLFLCQQLNATMHNLQRYVRDLPPPKSYSDPIRLFVMQPYNQEAKVVEGALRAVFESEPYWFQIILARDRTMAADLFENVKRHMKVVDGFIAEISDLNANVMIELGMTENDPQERPVLILRRSQATSEFPADLKAKLYIEYELPPREAKDAVETLATQLRGMLQAIDAVNLLLGQRRARYLSKLYIDTQTKRAHVSLEQGEKDQLQRNYLTIEQLQAATAEEISKKTGFSRELAELIVRVFGASAAERAVA